MLCTRTLREFEARPRASTRFGGGEKRTGRVVGRRVGCHGGGGEGNSRKHSGFGRHGRRERRWCEVGETGEDELRERRRERVEDGRQQHP